MGDCEAGKERAGAAERLQESGAAAPARGGRMSPHRKTAFLAAGEAALATRPESGQALENERLKARLGEVMVEGDLLHEKIAVLEAGRPLGRWRRRP